MEHALPVLEFFRHELERKYLSEVVATFSCCDDHEDCWYMSTLYWWFFINLAETRVTWGEGTSNVEFPP